jgi:hypothetical protein
MTNKENICQLVAAISGTTDTTLDAGKTKQTTVTQNHLLHQRLRRKA